MFERASPPRRRSSKRDTEEGTEAAPIACHLLQTARRHGTDVSGLEQRFGISLGKPIETQGRIPISRMFELWEELLRRTNNPAFPFDAATIPFPASVALFVLVTTSRQTARDALEAIVLHERLITAAVGFELKVNTRTATLHVIGPEPETTGAKAMTEFLVAHIVHNLRCATGNRCQPRRVQFRHSDRGGRRPPGFLGPVTFGAANTIVELDIACLDHPIDVLNGLSQILSSRVDPPDLISRVRNAIAYSLSSSGRAGIGAAARTLGMTPRTLQRQLPSGVTFQGLVQNAQRDLALALVQSRTDLTIKEISTKVGFASARAFSRAYRRWTGSSPAVGRLQRQ